MKAYINSRLGRRFVGMILSVALLVGAMGWFGIRSASATIDKETHAMLRAASDGAEAQLREFLLYLRRTTEGFATDEVIRDAVNGGKAGAAWPEVLTRLRLRIPEAQEVFCLDSKGRVVATSTPALVGRDFSGSDCFKLGRGGFYAGDLARDAEDGQIHWRMSAPVNESGERSGVVVVSVDPAVLSTLVSGKRVLNEGADSQSFRMGRTGETYIVNRDGYLLTPSRFAPNGVLKAKVETQPVRMWKERGTEMIGDYRDYRNVPVSGSSAIFKAPQWLLVTEIDFSQALAPVARWRDVLLGLILGVGLGATVLAGAFAQRIIRPVQALTEADQALANGDEDRAMVCEERLPEDEIGDFVRNRNLRIREQLQRQRDLVREQQARAEAAAELERLSYSMVHDMRAPLRAIIMSGELMQEEGLSATQKQHFARMKSAAERMDRLICDMLKYSSMLRQELPLSAINTPELIRRLIEENPGLREQRGSINIDPHMPPVNGNGVVLMECFAALLDNALRYGKPGETGKVKVSAEGIDGKVRIYVVDDGVGMSKEFQTRVFGLFERGTDAPGGSGIGLALVRVAVERMGGRVGVESEECIGSRFWIELKRAE